MTTPSGTGNTAPSLTTATVLLYLWALLSYAARIWVRLRKTDSWGWDDTSISLSALFMLGNLIAICQSIHHGYGNYWADISLHDDGIIRESLYASQILYVLSIGITRISASFFTARFLTRDRNHDRVANGFTGLCSLWTVASIFAIAVRSPFSSPWSSLEGSSDMFMRWLVIESLGVLIDVCAIGVSVYLVWTLQMPLGKRLIVCVIFGCRLLIIPLIVLRLILLQPSNNPEYLIEPNLKANIVTQATLDATFILASITCLKPFLRPFHSQYTISTTDPDRNPSGWEKPSKMASHRMDALYELSSAAHSKKSKTIVSVQSHVGDGEWSDELDLVQSGNDNRLVLRPDRCVERFTAISGGHPPLHGHNDPDGIMVSRTSVWNVTYE